MLLIIYRHRPVALAGTRRFYLVPEIAQLPDGDPVKTFVCFLALYARDVEIGALPGAPSSYDPIHGERYARAALIPATEFLMLQERMDYQLAAHFGVPPEQISARREDFAGELKTATRWSLRRNAQLWCRRRDGRACSLSTVTSRGSLACTSHCGWADPPAHDYDRRRMDHVTLLIAAKSSPNEARRLSRALDAVHPLVDVEMHVDPGAALDDIDMLCLWTPCRRDGLQWPHRDGLKWPRLALVDLLV